MTLPDTPEIMEEIISTIHYAKNEYNAATAEYESAVALNDEVSRILASGRCERWIGYIDGLSYIKKWILTYEKQEPERSEKDCMWEGDE